MDDHTGCTAGFTISKETWYAASTRKEPEIIIGMYHEEGGTSGEFSLREDSLALELRAYSDSWHALRHMEMKHGLLSWLADHEGASLADAAAALPKLGLADRTQRERLPGGPVVIPAPIRNATTEQLRAELARREASA